MKVGVLALQGDFEAHGRLLEGAGAVAIQVRTTEDLSSADALVIPGGESTTIGKLAAQYELIEPIRDRAMNGMPVLGTCAGMIVCARWITEGDQPMLGLVDIKVRRNAYGRQVDSFEADINVADIGTMHAVFIRAPVIDRIVGGVEVLSSYRDRAVVVRQDNVTLASFHPELAGDDRLHRLALGL